MDAERKCLYCGEPILGRADKRFCSDSCRNAYHNQRNRETNRMIRNINRVLKKNWQILNELNTHEKARVHRQTLLKKGFRFDFYTSCHTTRKGDTYYYVYDQGYLRMRDSDFYLLVTKSLDV